MRQKVQGPEHADELMSAVENIKAPKPLQSKRIVEVHFKTEPAAGQAVLPSSLDIVVVVVVLLVVFI